MILQDIPSQKARRLAEMGLENFAPYLMNRLMGRYNAALREEMAKLGLTTTQMRSLAVLSVLDGILIRELAVYAVVQQSTLSRGLDALVKSICLENQGLTSHQGRFSRIRVFAKMSSFRMTAVIATLNGFPAFLSLS